MNLRVWWMRKAVWEPGLGFPVAVSPAAWRRFVRDGMDAIGTPLNHPSDWFFLQSAADWRRLPKRVRVFEEETFTTLVRVSPAAFDRLLNDLPDFSDVVPACPLLPDRFLLTDGDLRFLAVYRSGFGYPRYKSFVDSKAVLAGVFGGGIQTLRLDR